MFQMVKTLLKIIFGCKICICQSIFKFFVAPFLALLECKRMPISYFAGDVSEQDDLHRAVSKGWRKESSL